MPQSPPKLPDEPLAVETIAAMSHQLLGGKWRQTDLAAVVTLLSGLEQDMVAFHRVELGELELATVYIVSETAG